MYCIRIITIIVDISRYYFRHSIELDVARHPLYTSVEKFVQFVHIETYIILKI